MPIELIQANADGQITAHQSTVAGALLANNMNVNALRTNATLRKDEWELLDRAVIEIARERPDLVCGKDVDRKQVPLLEELPGAGHRRMSACSRTQRTACSCVPNQASGFSRMYSINSRNTTIRERWPMTCGCIVRTNVVPSS